MEQYACLLSHLNAILTAFNAGDEFALILEDDSLISETFVTNWKAIADSAPSDWNVLQLATNHEAVLRHGMEMKQDLWINWLPDHYGTMGYLINREGMRQILTHTMNSGTDLGEFIQDRSFIWKSDKPGVVVADESVYFFAKNTYTSTRPWVFCNQHGALTSTIHISNGPGSTFYKLLNEDMLVAGVDASIRASSTKRMSSVMVLMNSRLSNAGDLHDEVERLRSDVEALSSVQETAHWVVNFALTSSHLKKLLMEKLVDLPDCVEFRISVSEDRFNKFALVADIANDYRFLQYDYILMKDNDMRLAGFPWHAFMESIGDTVIAAPLHQSVDESLAHFSGKPRQYFQFHEASGWKTQKVPEYQQIQRIPADFIEQAFTLFDAPFAHWFFNKVLATDYLSQSLDWGLDMIWCHAASEFYPERQNICSVIPVTALHEDTKQFKPPKSLQSAKSVIEQDSIMARWLARSNQWMELLSNRAGVADVLKKCQRMALVSTSNLTQCAQETAVTFKNWHSTAPVQSNSTSPIDEYITMEGLKYPKSEILQSDELLTIQRMALSDATLNRSLKQHLSFQAKRGDVVKVFPQERRFSPDLGRWAALRVTSDFAYFHIFKSGGTTMEIQTQEELTNIDDVWVQNRRWVTFVRDPIDHFFSGWAETGRIQRTERLQRQGLSATTHFDDKEAIPALLEEDYNTRIEKFLDDCVRDLPYPILNGHPQMHSVAQANFMMNPDGEIWDQIEIVGELHEIPQVLDLVGFRYDDTKEIGRNAMADPFLEIYYPRRLDLLTDDTIRRICDFVAIDYFMFDYELPEPCRDMPVTGYTTWSF